MSVVEIRGEVVWTVKQGRSGALIAECDSLGLTLQADNMEELESMIEEGQHMLFRDLLVENELEAFLQARGWRMTTPIPDDAKEGGVQFRARPTMRMEPRASA